jgi:alpha-tubulin suppressor-like RCC1 family protein
MSTQEVLPAETGLAMTGVTITPNWIVIAGSAMASSAACPGCGTNSDRIHSHYIGTVADLPWQGRRVALRVTVRRFRCRAYGQLGNGNMTDSPTPQQVQGVGGIGTLSNITAVAGGGVHSLALTSTGSVYTWGINADGELGNGTTTNSSTPVLVTGLSGVNVTAVAGGEFHSLALTSTGTVYAWGANGAGELGNGSTTLSFTPVPVTGLSGTNVTAIAAGAEHSVALTSTGAVYAWGDNEDGQLGNGTTTNALTALLVPFPANGSAAVVAISAGDFDSFALESDGSLWAWGDNFDGQYGNGTRTDSLTPIEVYTPAGGYGISVFAEGYLHSLAIVTPVPEPGSLGLVLGVAGVVGAWRLRRATSAARPAG